MPKVSILNGKAIIERMGRMSIVKRARTTPPNKKLANPPLTFRPEIICEAANIEKPSITIFRSKDFIGIWHY